MDRIALVIGNSDYSNVSKLTNPKNDANNIECVLRKLNFDVTKVLDARLIDIQQAVNVFLQALDEYAVGLLFYAGHGTHVVNYLHRRGIDYDLINYCIQTGRLYESQPYPPS